MGKTVLITGGSRGIGAACVRAFAQEGWRVAFLYRERADKAGELCRTFPDTLALQADLSKPDEVERGVEQAQKHLGTLDALVCNAGIAEQKMFCDLSDGDWTRMLDVNLMGAVRVIRAALPGMVHKKSGSIVTVSSIWGVRGASCESHYAASKAALIGLSSSLALELGPSGIRVNCVAPGVIETDMNASHTPETMRELAFETPLGRIGTAEEAAQSILFLCSEKASFITGQTLGVTGGF
ncbi:SDR family NAD(P)-dependent oxidoreductase [Agathobaculum sp.]|uniref:SDR family NAD(P)-dependent oxidoreductase n=1 Tax=Agathobaculum sp. TaxID=2048138 RepID=UPI002A800C22|nr:SDR family oxidoreductase [Agathobaculum sp.]MDY3618499.1 SDR family oxidoreductase [Agathobaculum sp.]